MASAKKRQRLPLKDLQCCPCGRRRVLCLGKRRVRKHTYWLVECDCGTRKGIRADSLIDGSIVSCGGIHVATGIRFGRLVVMREAG
jgi:hypothetical protein